MKIKNKHYPSGRVARHKVMRREKKRAKSFKMREVVGIAVNNPKAITITNVSAIQSNI
jgi:hypothetical protein